VNHLKQTSRFALLGAGLTLLAAVPLSMMGVLPGPWVREARAIVGAPLTPVSFAGVARRTCRRTVVATSYAAASEQQAAAAQQQAAAAQQQADTAQQQAAAATAAATLPVGSTMPELPQGCETVSIDGTSYFHCGPNWVKTALSGGNIVYQVVADPTQ
jgi:hypothetical protein